MKNIKDISNYLFREIAVYENKKKMLEYQNGISPKKTERFPEEITNNELKNNEEEAQESPNSNSLLLTIKN